MKNYAVCGGFTKASFLSKVLDATCRFTDIWMEKEHKKNEPCSDLKNIEKAFAGIRVSEKTGKVINALLDAIKSSKCSDSKGGKFLTFVPFACVVPIRNRNNHRYELNKPVIMIRGVEGQDHGMYGLRADGSVGCTGNELPRLYKSLRPATRVEINAIVDSLYS